MVDKNKKNNSTKKIESKSKKVKKTEKSLKKQLEDLQAKYDEQTEILKKVQNDYVNLKFDLDRLQRQTQEREKTLELELLLSSVKKFLPFVEDLRKSLETLPADKKSDPLVQWIQLVYDNFIKTLESMDIKPIDSIWQVPDSNLHEPVSLQPVEDKKLKWKIIQEFERGFVYKKGDKEIVLNTSKVVVGQ